MPPERYAVGIDLGGSKLRGGLLSDAGQLVARLELQTEAWKGPAGVLANLKGLITRLLDSTDRSRIAGIGIAAAGQIHPKTHAVVYAPNLEWHDVPLRAEIESLFELPTYVENDVRAAAWGEYRFGVGRGAQSLIAVFVGTGVGSGAVVDGILLRGFNNAAGVPTSLAEETGHDASRLTGALVARAAAAGDAFAREVWSDAERHLGTALAGYVTLLNPERLILGGGIMSKVPALFDTLARRVHAQATVMAREVRVQRAGLADSAGIFGAADRVWTRV